MLHKSSCNKNKQYSILKQLLQGSSDENKIYTNLRPTVLEASNHKTNTFNDDVIGLYLKAKPKQL